MSQQPENIIAVLDAGSSKIRVLVAEIHEGALRYRGHGIVDAARHAQRPHRRPRPRRCRHRSRRRHGRRLRADRHRDDASSPSAVRTFAASTAAAASVSAPACARSPAKTSAPPSIAPAPSPSPPTAKSSTSSRSSSSSTSSPASTTPSAWSAIASRSISTSPPAPPARSRASSPAPTRPASKSPRPSSKASPPPKPPSPPTSASSASASSTSAPSTIRTRRLLRRLRRPHLRRPHRRRSLHQRSRRRPPRHCARSRVAQGNYGHCRRHLGLRSSPKSRSTGLPGYEPRTRTPAPHRRNPRAPRPRALHMLRDNLRQGGVLEALGAGCVSPAAARTCPACSKLPRACCAFRPPRRSRAALAHASELATPEFSVLTACCSTPTAPASSVRRKTRDCAPSCAPFSPEASDAGQDALRKRNGALAPATR